MAGQLGRWLCALVLLLPATSIYVGHYGASKVAEPTGFIQYDMGYYMANARECFDRGDGSPFYALPYSDTYDNNAIYFQPQIYVLGLAEHLSGLDPGTVFVLFGLVFGVVGFRAAIAIYERRVGLDSTGAVMGLIAMAWGGGVIWLMGMVASLVQVGANLDLALAWSFQFDPFGGWWFVDLGRNFVYPTEAYYHSLFLGTILALLVRRWHLAYLAVLVLAISHPFTGSELIAVVGLWAGVERFLMKSRDVPLWFIAGVGGAGLALIGYYGLYLSSDPEHYELLQQWTGPNLLLPTSSLLPAYVLVAFMAIQGHTQRTPVWSSQGDPFDRLCVLWATVAFLLSKHDLFMPPHQPLHFTRGYTWLPLFLLGARWLRTVFDRLWVRSIAARVGAVALLFLFVADETAWLTLRTREAFGGQVGMYLTAAQRESLMQIQTLPVERPLVVTDDPMLGYLVTIYTPFRAFVSHWANTPFITQKVADIGILFRTCKIPPALEGRELLVISTMGLVFCDLGGVLGKPVMRSPVGRVYYVHPPQSAR
jgi:hypothetical protein